MLENSDIEVHERYSRNRIRQRSSTIIDVLVALKNGKIDELEAQATLKVKWDLHLMS